MECIKLPFSSIYLWVEIKLLYLILDAIQEKGSRGFIGDMEEDLIRQKFLRGYINNVVVERKLVGVNGRKVHRYVIYFFDKKKPIQLVKQREGVREFASLQTAANTIERIGPDKFHVFL